VLATGGEDRRIVLWRAGASAVLEAGTPAAARPEEAVQPAGGGQPERVTVDGQANLVVNPAANQGRDFWTAEGDVTVEQEEDGTSSTSTQTLQDAARRGRHRAVLVVARTASGRVEETGQTGLPYLWTVIDEPAGRGSFHLRIAR
jgi:hypothetical protein